MTDIDTMPAGRELDALVAEKVMEWVWIDFDNGDGRVRRPYPGDSWNAQHSHLSDKSVPMAYGWDSDLPPYSTDIAAAWRVVEKLKESHGVAVEYFGRQWVAYFGDDSSVARADTPPLAICRAALKAKLLWGKE